jgi:hypothetical protein
MHGRRTALASAVWLVVTLVLLVACGRAASTSGTASSSASAPSGQADPNAPEVAAAGDIPDTQVFVPYTAADGSFVVSVPEGWARTADGSAVVFSDKFNSVRIDTAARATAPDPASARATEVPQLAGAPGFQLGDVQTVQRTAGPAVLITYQVSSAPDPVTGKTVTQAVERYEFWHAGREVMLTLSGPKGSDNVDPWRKVTDSLRWLR